MLLHHHLPHLRHHQVSHPHRQRHLPLLYIIILCYLTFTFFLDNDKLLLGIPFKVSTCSVDSSLVLIVKVWHLLEFKFLGERPEELLDWELVHACVGVTNSNVIVGIQT